MTLNFTKMSGAGNDFVVVEDAAGLDGKALARRLCPRRTSVGADGLILLRRAGSGRPPSMAYFNADGSRAFCGNGSRCAALWLHRRGWAGRRLEFRSDEGVLQAVVTGPERVRLRMPKASEPRRLSVSAVGRRFGGVFLDTGVPHFVVPVRGLGRFQVEKFGRALRDHKAFAPAGTNVDFVEWGRPLALRTYERGVEAETLACGTGAAAAALAAAASGRARPAVRVRVASGDLLTVSWSRPGEPWLEGPARIVYEGAVPAGRRSRSSHSR